jgi:SAUR family protein
MVWGRKSGADEEEKVPKGHVPMVAGITGDGGERVLVPVRLLSDPSIAELLDIAAQQYGYRQPGVLRVPCDAGHFRRVVDGAMHRCGITSRRDAVHC